MMQAFDELRAEHETILRVMATVEEVAQHADESAFSEAYIGRVLDFIRKYIEDSHHGKEERALFPRLRDNPFLQDIARALHEDHEQEAALVAGIERALDEDRSSDILARRLLAYIAFLRDHIHRENELIFDAVEPFLSETTLAELLAEFRAIESDALGSAGVADLLPLEGVRA